MAVIHIDAGDDVICDFCGEDFTKSHAEGGLQFQSKAVCPTCAPKVERDAERYGEQQFIRARCPARKSFAAWVREDLR